MTETVTPDRVRAEPADDAPHLLLVDDDRRIRDLLSRFLAGEGYRVTTAKSAADARAKLTGLHFDLLILDVMMPGETGFDLARSIRTSSAVPIIMLTARHEAEARIEGLQIGDLEARIAGDEVDHPVVGAAETELFQHMIGVADEVAVGEKQQFDDVPALVAGQG